MAKILLVSDNNEQNLRIEQTLKKLALAVIVCTDEKEILNYAEKSLVSLIIVDEAVKSLDALILCKKLPSYTVKENICVVSLVDADTTNQEILKLTASYVTKPLNDLILGSCVLSNLKLKKAVDTLSMNNSELAKSLYQLDVLYNTSTQLAGSLDKQKLINIMFRWQ